MLVWHYFRNDLTTGEGNYPVAVGETMEARYRSGSIVRKGDILPCHHALHGSVSPLDALGYAPGTMVQRAELWGELQSNGNPIDKYGARYRQCLAILDAGPILVEFACRCYEDVAYLIEDKNLRRVTDKAVATARLCVACNSEEDKTAAGGAALTAKIAVGNAGFAITSAAGQAAWAALCAAASVGHFWTAGRAVASTVASSVTAAACAAASAAAFSAMDNAWVAALAAAYKKQSNVLESMLINAMEVR